MGQGTAEASSESFTYDAAGRLVARTDARSHDWSREYDGYGRRAASVDPLGNRTEHLYDDGGQVKESRSLGSGGGLLSKSEATYDLLGRPVEQTRHLWSSDPVSATPVTTATAYDAAGNVLTATDPLGRVTSFEYDAAERMTSRTDPAGNRVDYALNATGQPESVTLTEVVAGGGAASTTTTHEYDALGRTVASTDPLGNTTRQVFTAAGRARFVIDAEGHSTERVYDSLGRMLSETLPEGIRIELGYDAKGNRTSYRDALGNTTIWSYDALDRVTAVAYPDGTSESYAHDGTGNVTQITQASGTVVAQTHDAAGRLIARAITPADGVEGPTAESFAYDGLGRLTQAVSGSGAEAIASTRTYDSLSRLTSETTAGKTVAYQHDPAGSLTGITYPSGATVTHQVDALGRIAAIPGIATYGYRGPDLVAQKTVGALSGTTTYDAGRRPTAREMKVGSAVRFHEGMSWTGRGLLQKHSRLVENDTAFSMGHDGAGRLTQRAHVGAISAESTDPTDGVTSFSYDVAQNRTGKVSVGTEEPRQVVPTPPAVQNRPTSIGAVPLSWNSVGNLQQKGDQQYVYDWRNRLVRVTTTGGAVLASYTYDVFDRLATRTSGGSVESTAWAGWRPIELYEAGELRQRRTYGLGLDELARLEVDLDASGGLDQVYTPLYDQTGNLVALADAVGEIVERYEYSPYGLRLATVDSIPPEIRQLLFRDGGLRLDLSKEILRRNFQHLANAPGSAAQGLSAKDGTSEPLPLTLTVTGTGEDVPVTVDFPVELGRFAFRRMTITPTGTAPAAGTDVTLRIEAETVQDRFFNSPGQAFEVTFSWPAGETVLTDSTPPEVEEVVTRDGRLEVAFSEEVDLGAAQSAITIDGQTMAWELDPVGYRLRTVDLLTTSAQSLVVGTGVQDLAGLPLQSALTIDLTDPIATADPAPTTSSVTGASEDGALATRALTLPSSVTEVFYQLAEANQILTSATGNRFGFHGREIDFATGLVYFRHRWYDPEMGRFLQQDPLGYVDGPNLYQYALNNPSSFSDPMGLATGLMALHAGEVTADAETRQIIELTDDVRGEFWTGATYDQVVGVVQAPIIVARAAGYCAGDLSGCPGAAWEIVRRVPSGILQILQDPKLFARALGNASGGIFLLESGGVQYLVWLQRADRGTPDTPRPPLRLDLDFEHHGLEYLDEGVRFPEVPSTGARFPERPGQVQHIFRDAPGHLADTPANRTLLQQVADDASTTLGTDRFGNIWSARTLEDGTQVWVQTRNGVIQNGGLNQTPRVFNPETGLSGH